MEADYPRSHLKHQLKSFLIKTRKRIAWLWYGTQVELIVIGSKTPSDLVRHVRINAWSWVYEKVQIERAISGPTYLFDLLPCGVRRQRRTTEGTERACVGDGCNQRGAAKATHRRLDDWMADAEQIYEIGAGPHF
jgi:hypothetical protein